MLLTRSPLLKGLSLASTLYYSSAVGALSINFDYSYDTNNFYTPEKRAVMNQAASYFAGFTDQLATIDTVGSGNWQLTFGNPSAFGGSFTVENLVVAENSITVFAGAVTTAVPILGIAGNSTITADNSDVLAQVAERGQGTTNGPAATDYAPWGGIISLNSQRPWNDTLNTPLPHQNDMLTTVTHELAHILGIGKADSWFNQSQLLDDKWYFTGEHAMALYGGPIPLDQYGLHWAEGTFSLYNGNPQETLMDPSTPTGERQLMTDLDMAALQDIGWDVTPVPLPGAAGYFAAALSLLALRKLKRKTKQVTE